MAPMTEAHRPLSPGAPSGSSSAMPTSDGTPPPEDTQPIPRPAAPGDPGPSLPRRVPQTDRGATTVSPAAFTAGPRPTGPIPPEGPRRGLPAGGSGCLARMAILAVFIAAGVAILLLTFGLLQYSSLASTLPAVDDLRANAAQFETTRIFDRAGNLLYEILDPQAGRRTYVTLDEISPAMVAAVLATEDSQFYSHAGFDPLAIGRAVWQNLQGGETVSGASTITQQIARNLLFTPEERSQRTALRKIREILLAAEINRRYTKEEILELYLNQVYFGNLAYGVEAAAQTYFGTTAGALTLPQASFLAGLIQAPAVYDIFTNREAALDRHRQVLTLMVLTSQEQDCIAVSNAPDPVCVSPEEAGAAIAQVETYPFRPADIQIRYPHWVNYIRTQLEQMYDPQTIYRSGFNVYTTLDPQLQDLAQTLVTQQVTALADRHVTNGALVSLDPQTGEILAMVGSADFNNAEIDGQINMSVAPRQPGSSIKPLTYAHAFEQGWTPGTLIWDVPSEFPPSGNPDDPRPPYEPENYDERFHGPVTVRSALANSYNIPAVKTLDFIGIYDDPTTPQEEGLVPFARRMGITTLDRDDYGLSLTLGGGDVSLLELTSAYSVFANLGNRRPPVSITRIVDHEGTLAYEHKPAEPMPVLRPELAFLITSILADNDARRPMFGGDSLLKLPFPAAAKTGTTNDFRDNWTLGYTPQIATGVWVGNADYTPMQNTTGLSGAAPIWNAFMNAAVPYISGGEPDGFERPPGIIERTICALSGAEPSEWCPDDRIEVFAADQPPLPQEQDLWQEPWVDSYTLLLASGECQDFAKQKLGLEVADPWARKWLTEEDAGKDWGEEHGFEDKPVFFVPDESCTSDSPRPFIDILSPIEGAVVNSGPLQIVARIGATGRFRDWVLEVGEGYEPKSWPDLARDEQQHEQPDVLYTWDMAGVKNGPVTLRLSARSQDGGSAERRIHVFLNLPEPTPTPMPTPTAVPPPTATTAATPTATPTATETPTP